MQTTAPPSELKTEEPAAPFRPENWKYILTLLALIIVADKKTFQEEIDTFRDGINELRAIIDPTICFTEQMSHDWFWRNKPELEEILDSRSHDTAICEIIAPIKSIPHKLDVISCMVRIAVSDGEYCEVEKSLIAKTCLYWNVRSNFQQNLECLHKPDDQPTLVDYLEGHRRYEAVNKTYR